VYAWPTFVQPQPQYTTQPIFPTFLPTLYEAQNNSIGQIYHMPINDFGTLPAAPLNIPHPSGYYQQPPPPNSMAQKRETRPTTPAYFDHPRPTMEILPLVHNACQPPTEKRLTDSAAQGDADQIVTAAHNTEVSQHIGMKILKPVHRPS
jgi:hypothetical protein